MIIKDQRNHNKFENLMNCQREREKISLPENIRSAINSAPLIKESRRKSFLQIAWTFRRGRVSTRQLFGRKLSGHSGGRVTVTSLCFNYETRALAWESILAPERSFKDSHPFCSLRGRVYRCFFARKFDWLTRNFVARSQGFTLGQNKVLENSALFRFPAVRILNSEANKTTTRKKRCCRKKNKLIFSTSFVWKIIHEVSSKLGK